MSPHRIFTSPNRLMGTARQMVRGRASPSSHTKRPWTLPCPSPPYSSLWKLSASQRGSYLVSCTSYSHTAALFLKGFSNSLNYVCEYADIGFCMFYLPHAEYHKHVLRKSARIGFVMHFYEGETIYTQKLRWQELFHCPSFLLF